MSVAQELDRSDLRSSRRSPRFRRLSGKAKQNVVLKLESIAVIVLAQTASREAACEFVIRQPYLIIAIAQIHGVDKIQLRSNVFAYCQPSRWLGFIRDQVGF